MQGDVSRPSNAFEPAAREPGGRQIGGSARGAFFALVAIALLSFLLREALGAAVRGPFVFMDELGYQRIAWSFSQTGHLELFGKGGLAYSPLYSIVLAPLARLASGVSESYRWAKGVNALLMSLSIFPTYAIARFLLSRRGALAVAALAALAPLMMYANLLLSENLAYPLFLLAVWAMLRALRDPRPRNDLLLLAAILVACSARLQLVALIPTAVTAIVLLAVVGARSRGDGIALALGRALLQHLVFLGPIALVAVAAFARAVANGGKLPLAGRYAIVGTARASAVQVGKLAVQHLAGLDLATGVAPFAAALLGVCALRRSGFARNGVIFASVALSATFWLLLEVAFDAAAFDRRATQTRSVALPPDLPRIHERYLIYLIPLFLVAFVAMLRRRLPLPAILSASAVAAVLPAAIPFGRDINNSIVVDSFALQVFGRSVAGSYRSIHHATTAAVLIAAALALLFTLAVLGRHRRSAVALTAAVFVVMSAFVWVRVLGAANASTSTGLPARPDWVDRVVGNSSVAMVGGRGVQRIGLLETAFYNVSIERLYYTCKMAFGADFGERALTIGAAGSLGEPTGPLEARYAVVPRSFGIRGAVLARDPRSGLELVAPVGGKLVVTRGARAAARCAG